MSDGFEPGKIPFAPFVCSFDPFMSREEREDREEVDRETESLRVPCI